MFHQILGVASRILSLRDLLKMFPVKHNYTRLGAEIAQTDNSIACVMYCLSSISCKLFVALSLTTFHLQCHFTICRIIFNLSSRGYCTVAYNLLLNLKSTPILLTFTIFHQFTAILINAAVCSRHSTILIPVWLMIVV